MTTAVGSIHLLVPAVGHQHIHEQANRASERRDECLRCEPEREEIQYRPCVKGPCKCAGAEFACCFLVPPTTPDMPHHQNGRHIYATCSPSGFSAFTSCERFCAFAPKFEIILATLAMMAPIKLPSPMTVAMTVT